MAPRFFNMLAQSVAITFISIAAAMSSSATSGAGFVSELQRLDAADGGATLEKDVAGVAFGRRRRSKNVEPDIIWADEKVLEGMVLCISYTIPEAVAGVEDLAIGVQFASKLIDDKLMPFMESAPRVLQLLSPLSSPADLAWDLPLDNITWAGGSQNMTGMDIGLEPASLVSVKPKAKRKEALRKMNIQGLMFAQHLRLDRLWQIMGMMKLHMEAVGTYLVSHRELFMSCAVLQDDEGFFTPKIEHREPEPFDAKGEKDKNTKVKLLLVYQIRSLSMQLEDIWDNVGAFTRALEDLRRQINRFTSCKATEGICFENADCCSGNCSLDATCSNSSNTIASKPIA